MSKSKDLTVWIDKDDLKDLQNGQTKSFVAYAGGIIPADAASIKITIPMPEKKKEFTVSDLSELYNEWVSNKSKYENFHHFVGRKVFKND